MTAFRLSRSPLLAAAIGREPPPVACRGNRVRSNVEFAIKQDGKGRHKEGAFVFRCQDLTRNEPWRMCLPEGQRFEWALFLVSEPFRLASGRLLHQHAAQTFDNSRCSDKNVGASVLLK